jgi:hypothetical protein
MKRSPQVRLSAALKRSSPCLSILSLVFLLLGSPALGARIYTTTFPSTENPISEGGNWINGKTNGLDWADVRTTPGFAFGTQSGTNGYDDSTALLTGTWGPDQTAEATVHLGNQGVPPIYEEVELRLRSAISAHTCTGYEITFQARSVSNAYVQIVRWNGPLGSFTYVTDRNGPGLHDGDVVKATIQGSTITVYLNGTQILQGTDSTYATGAPGIGFYLQGATGLNADYGFTNFMATDDTTPPSAPGTVRDGTGADISTTTSTTQLSANWNASTDADSGISGYQYAIGTSASGTQTVNWTSLGNVTTVTKGSLSLTVGQTYYFSVKAVNGAGLTGSATNSNGQTVVSGGGSTTYFSDNFESWTVHGGAWSSVTGETSLHTLNTSTDHAAAGSKSLKITDTDTSGTYGACLVKNFSPTISADIYVRFYLFLPTGYGSTNQTGMRRIMRLWCGGNDVQMSTKNGTLLSMQEVGAWGATNSAAISENAWHCVEVHGATPSASTLLEFWLDGVKNSTTLNGSFSGSTVWTYMELGDVCRDGGTNGTGTYYMDEVAVANSYIGPLDSTPPSQPLTVRDGVGADISTTSSTTQLSANWDASTDNESGISGYQYAIGTSAGGTQTVNWTSLGNVTTVTKTSLSLTVGQTYYFSVKAVNGVGLTGSATNSNGQTVISSFTTYFSDNFENWTVHGGAWSSVSGETATHTLNTSTDYAKAGSKGLKLTDTDTTSSYGACLVKNFSPAISADIYVRFYVFLPTGYGSTNTGAARRIIRVWCGGNRAQMSINSTEHPVLEEIGAWGGTTGATALSENAWHCIEVHGATPSASTLLEFWLDGTKNSTTINGSFSGSTTWDYMEFGDVAVGGGANGTGTFYMDEVIVSNAYNGP